MHIMVSKFGAVEARVFGYCRVSTISQAERGESLKTQESRISAYAQMCGLQNPRFFTDAGVSGRTPLSKRPDGLLLLNELQAGDTVIATKLDRMFRSASDALRTLEDLKKRGVHLHLIDLGGDCTGNGVARLVFQILAAVAEAERERISERILEVKARQRADGQFIGGRIPFGWANTPSGLVEDANAQRALTFMRSQRKKGVAFRTIAEGVQTRFGVKLSHAGVRRILSGERRIDVKGYAAAEFSSRRGAEPDSR